MKTLTAGSGISISNGVGSVTVSSTAVSVTIGDVKFGFQSADHGGWIRLEGRAKSTLTSTQQAAATSLGIGTTIPDATNRYLAQVGSGSPGNFSGNGTNHLITLQQTDLPNVSLAGNTTGAVGPTINGGANSGGAPMPTTGQTASGDYGLVRSSDSTTATTTTGGVALDVSSQEPDLVNHVVNHYHGFSFLLNGGVTQTQVNIKPATLMANCFIYLGP